MNTGAFVAGQLRKPAGLFGKVFGVLMNRVNKDLNKFMLENLQLESVDQVLEIGFGDGENLIDCAKNDPYSNFSGIEVYPSGIGQCLINANKYDLKNLRLFCNDAVDVLNKRIANESLDVINIFFPDPWPKKRHHKRRLISEDFIVLIKSKLKQNGLVHICTDWADYGHAINALFESNKEFKLLETFPKRLQTKFEKKGLAIGHSIYEFAFQLVL